MKKLLSLGVASLLVTAVMTLPAQDRDGNDGIRERFVGAWRLASIEQQGADGKVHKADTRPPLAHTRSKTLTTSPITSRAHWSEPLSAKTFRARLSFRANSSS